MKTIPLDLALRASQRLCRDAAVDLILPDSPRRMAVVYGLAAAHSITRTGWDLEHAREHVSVTLPGAGMALDLLSHIPYVGGLLRELSKEMNRPAIHLAPSILREGDGAGARLLGVVQHELGHVGSIRHGGALWCVAYGAIGEVRAGGEAPCFGVGIAHQVLLGGRDPADVEAQYLAALDGYGLSDDDKKLTAGVLRSNVTAVRGGVDPGGVVAESLAALRAEGWVA